MQWDANQSTQDRKDSIMRFETFFILNPFVPEGMCEEVESNRISATFE